MKLVTGLLEGVARPSLRIPPPLTGVPVNSRVSSKIQQLLNTLKRPKRPPLREFFVDDMEDMLGGECPQPGLVNDATAMTPADRGQCLSRLGLCCDLIAQ